MSLTGTRTYVGFGFGAIQSGLLLYEAFQSNAFRRLVVAEVVPDTVAVLRQAGGNYDLNIAQASCIEHAHIGPVSVENPSVDEDRARLIGAIAAAEEMGTAVPSVQYYVSQGPGSIHRLLAAGLRQKAAAGGPRAVIYTAENHNRAAEILEAQVMAEIPEAERPAVRSLVQFLNTVIGKMSGVITDAGEMQSRGLVPITPGVGRAFLVEAFNRILISQIRFRPAFERGIGVFEEKPDLLPFEEAKLYGHNAFHALAAYIGAFRAVPLIADVWALPGVLPFLRAAALEESGAPLIQQYSSIDPLFTLQGFAVYTDDLLTRMSNPYLGDRIERVARDPERKLGWDDRLIGTMRKALRAGMMPHRYALGAAAALAMMDPPTFQSEAPMTPLLDDLWRDSIPDPEEQDAVCGLIERERQILQRWATADYPPLEEFVSQTLP